MNDGRDTPDDEPGGTMYGLARFAEVAGVPYPTMWRHMRDGFLPDPDAVVGRQRLWRKATVDEWLQRNRRDR